MTSAPATTWMAGLLMPDTRVDHRIGELDEEVCQEYPDRDDDEGPQAIGNERRRRLFS